MEQHAYNTRTDNKKLSPGENLIFAWYKLLHIVKIHDDTNELVNNAALNFTRAITKFPDCPDSISIEAARGRFYIQKKKITASQ